MTFQRIYCPRCGHIGRAHPRVFTAVGCFQLVFILAVALFSLLIPLIGIVLGPLIFLSMFVGELGPFGPGCVRCGYVACTTQEEYENLCKDPNYRPPHWSNQAAVLDERGRIKPWA